MKVGFTGGGRGRGGIGEDFTPGMYGGGRKYFCSGRRGAGGGIFDGREERVEIGAGREEKSNGGG